MPNINRRTLLTSAAATGTLVATASFAQPDAVASKVDMTGKSVLITGCSSGFGRLMAEDFARKGAKVFATMRNTPRPEAEELIALTEAEGLDLHVLRLDVLQQNEIDDAVAHAEKESGGAIDVLVNNAGISTAGPVEIQDMQATQLLFDTNVFGPQRLMRAVLPAMRAAGSGQIFNVSSQLGRVIVPAYGQYSPTKFALEAMSEQIAYELVPHGIDVTIIQPGGYPTDIWENADRLTMGLLERADEKHTSGYEQIIEQIRAQGAAPRNTDPMDVPNAIAEIIAMPPGTRPLRRAVHPGSKPQMAINELCAEVQVGWLGQSPFGPWIKDVHNV